MSNRSVYVSEENGVKKFFAISYSNNGLKIDLYKFKTSDLTREFIDKLYKVWKSGDNIPFPNHDHIAWDLTVSSTIPEFTGIGRPEDRKQLDERAQKAIQRHYSNLHSEILSSEIRTLKGNVLSLSRNSKNEDIEKYLKIAISISHKIREGKDKNKNPNKGNNWRELLTPKDAYALNQDIQVIFEKINNLRKEIESDNLSKFKNSFNQLENEINTTSDFKKTREKLIEFQTETKKYYLTKENRDIIFEKIQNLFNLLSTKQREQKEKYESECKRNFENIQQELNNLDYQVNNLTF